MNRESLLACTVDAWRAQLSAVQWLVRVSDTARPSPERAALVADVLLEALFVGASPSALIAAYVEHGVVCDVVCVDALLASATERLRSRSSSRASVAVLVGVLQRVAHSLGRVAVYGAAASAGGDDRPPVGARYAERCRRVAAVCAALLELPDHVGAVAQLLEERSLTLLLAAGGSLCVPALRAQLLTKLPRASSLRRLWTLVDDCSLDVDAASEAWQPLASRVALLELQQGAQLMPLSEPPLTTAHLSWRQRAPPTALMYVLDRLFCRIVATDESTSELIVRDLRVAFSLARVPLATFYVYLLERLLEWYRKSPSIPIFLAVVLDVVEAACSQGAPHVRAVFDAATEIFAAPPPQPADAGAAWRDVQAFLFDELALIGSNHPREGRVAAGTAPPARFEATRDWFIVALRTVEFGVPMPARVIDDWLQWLDGGGLAALEYGDAYAAQTALLSCVAADADGRARVADAIVGQVRAASDVSCAKCGIVLSMLANAPPEISTQHELIRQAGRLRQLVEALVDVCDAVGNTVVSTTAAGGDEPDRNVSSSSVKRRRTEALPVPTRFSDAFLLLYRLQARAFDDGFAESATVLRGAERWQAAFLGRAAATPMSSALWMRATGFRVLAWEANEGAGLGQSGPLVVAASDALKAFVLATDDGGVAESLPPFSPWILLLAMPLVVDDCIVHVAQRRGSAARVAARFDALLRLCPCLMPAAVACLAEAAMSKHQRWLPLVAEPEHVQTNKVNRVLSPQALLLGELGVLSMCSNAAVVSVLSMSAVTPQFRRISSNWPTKQLVQIRMRFDEVQFTVMSAAAGHRSVSAAASIALGKATTGSEPSLLRTFFAWLTPRADFGTRLMRPGWVGDLLHACRSVTRGSSPRLLADWLVADLCKQTTSSVFATRAHLAWHAELVGCALSTLSRRALLDWLDTSLPQLVDRSESLACLAPLARSLVVACALSDADASGADAAPSACSALARSAAAFFLQPPLSVGDHQTWRMRDAHLPRDAFGRLLVGEFAFGGQLGALRFCDRVARAALARAALGARLGVAVLCRLLATGDALDGSALTPEQRLQRTFEIVHGASD
jgi:hypothetical protein